jgi:DNA-binding MarR family transcriptional regulator
MQPYFARFGISGSQWGLLRTLYRAEEGEGERGLRLTDLSDRLLIRSPSVTGAVNRLERAKLVVRSHSLTDHRAKHVELTPQGRELVERVLEVHESQIDRVLGGLSMPERKELYRLLNGLSHHLEKLLSQDYSGS